MNGFRVCTKWKKVLNLMLLKTKSKFLDVDYVLQKWSILANAKVW